MWGCLFQNMFLKSGSDCRSFGPIWDLGRSQCRVWDTTWVKTPAVWAGLQGKYRRYLDSVLCSVVHVGFVVVLLSGTSTSRWKSSPKSEAPLKYTAGWWVLADPVCVLTWGHLTDFMCQLMQASQSCKCKLRQIMIILWSVLSPELDKTFTDKCC